MVGWLGEWSLVVLGGTAPPAGSSGGCFLFFCFIFPSAPPLRQQHANANAKDKRERERVVTTRTVQFRRLPVGGAVSLCRWRSIQSISILLVRSDLWDSKTTGVQKTTERERAPPLWPGRGATLRRLCCVFFSFYYDENYCCYFYCF